MKHTYQDRLNGLLKKPVFLASEAREMGIHPSKLSYYVKKDYLERIGRGVYRGTHIESPIDLQWEELVTLAKSVPKSVVCLVSALAIYELTDEIPRVCWLAIPHATTAPKRDHTRFIRMRDMMTGKTEYRLEEEKIAIFNQERTVVDAFRYLSKEIAIKALKEAVKPKRQIKFDIKKFTDYAKQFRMNLAPYILMVTS
jgi:predicted transcriptional regulator of viral defense system